MNWETIKMHCGLSVIWFAIGLFFYLGWCGFMNLQPFTHKQTKDQLNSNCINQLQIAGYCCKSIEQFETGDCIK
jgi:hypothetical protein